MGWGKEQIQVGRGTFSEIREIVEGKSDSLPKTAKCSQGDNQSNSERIKKTETSVVIFEIVKK